ncbi:hypothetical protein F0562_031056 [Nyssa sinensis]|uniref:Uncharacterized protein n=1 Tax=Nyssa sinensis TaxID=561372 RepID=A0A5J5ASE7_9ASTE|nr:hypothetical protein F0562_031056 [Nyssa sinensis]
MLKDWRNVFAALFLKATALIVIKVVEFLVAFVLVLVLLMLFEGGGIENRKQKAYNMHGNLNGEVWRFCNTSSEWWGCRITEPTITFGHPCNCIGGAWKKDSVVGDLYFMMVLVQGLQQLVFVYALSQACKVQTKALACPQVLNRAV